MRVSNPVGPLVTITRTSFDRVDFYLDWLAPELVNQIFKLVFVCKELADTNSLRDLQNYRFNITHGMFTVNKKYFQYARFWLYGQSDFLIYCKETICEPECALTRYDRIGGTANRREVAG